MVTWGRAFRAAFVEVAFGYLWWLIGFVVFLLGLGIVIGPILPVSLLPFRVPAGTSCALGLVLIVIGFFVMVLGFVAARLKVQSELTAEAVWQTRPRLSGVAPTVPRPPPPPPL